MRYPQALLTLLAAFALGGCGLPPAVTIASYVLDGALLAASGKTANDHALSVVAQQDCSVLRVVVGDDVCRPYEPSKRAANALAEMGPTEAVLMTVADGRVIRVAVQPGPPLAQAAMPNGDQDRPLQDLAAPAAQQSQN